MDVMLNGWLLYQTLACRIWARSAFYQASGAYGFRDQLQDGMALSLPVRRRRGSTCCAPRRASSCEGDVQHWWLPHSGQGVRTHISDDRVWLAYRHRQLCRELGRRRPCWMKCCPSSKARPCSRAARRVLPADGADASPACSSTARWAWINASRSPARSACR
jgi:hypothetical protein